MSNTRFQTNDIIRYEDMANPGTNYRVVAVNDCPWSTYEIEDVKTGHRTTTDGRQRGWSLIAR